MTESNRNEDLILSGLDSQAILTEHELNITAFDVQGLFGFERKLELSSVDPYGILYRITNFDASAIDVQVLVEELPEPPPPPPPGNRSTIAITFSYFERPVV